MHGQHTRQNYTLLGKRSIAHLAGVSSDEQPLRKGPPSAGGGALLPLLAADATAASLLHKAGVLSTMAASVDIEEPEVSSALARVESAATLSESRSASPPQQEQNPQGAEAAAEAAQEIDAQNVFATEPGASDSATFEVVASCAPLVLTSPLSPGALLAGDSTCATSADSPSSPLQSRDNARPPPGFSPRSAAQRQTQQLQQGRFAVSEPAWIQSAPASPVFVSLATSMLAAAASPTSLDSPTAVSNVQPREKTVVAPAPSAPAPAPMAFDFHRRFRIVRPLQNSIYGRTMLCEDLEAKQRLGARSEESCLVVVKESSSSKMASKQASGAAIIGEDVHKEARLMRFLGVGLPLEQYLGAMESGAPLVHLTNAHIDRALCGLSAGFLHRHTDLNDSSGGLSNEALAQISVGSRFIAPLHGEFEQSDPDGIRTRGVQPTLHFLSTGYAAGGDLFSRVIAQGRLSESEARPIFRQLLQAVQFLHARGVPHLDISTENVCLTATGEVRLIDFGLSSVHERSTAAPLGGQTVASIDPTRHLLPADQPSMLRTEYDANGRARPQCQCGACFSSTRNMVQRRDWQVGQAEQVHPALSLAIASVTPDIPSSLASPSQMQVDSGSALVRPTVAQALTSRCRMLMRPICERHMRPGKAYTTAPELADPSRLAAPWDAFAADCFALGVLLFVCLTGKPPFEEPRATSTPSGAWWPWIFSGKWLQVAPRPGCHTESMSMSAKRLIDACIKPQQLRPTVDEMLEHPWLKEEEEDAATSSSA